MKGHSGKVAVFVRIRPTANFAQDLIEILPDGQTINIYQGKDSKKRLESRRSHVSSQSFQLERILHNVSQEEVYIQVCERVVLGALDGYNGTVMCFGQTGAGKTYTMTGSAQSYKQRGIIPRALQQVFQEMEKRTEHTISVHLSYLEIYNESLLDLLSSLQDPQHLCPQGIVVMEEPGKGVFIKGLSLHPVHSEEEALTLLFEGELNRIIGSNALNRKSSRSHCILTVHIESRSRALSDAKYIMSKLNLVDLAGSERLKKTGPEGQMLKEAVYINKSLSFLEHTILALADRHRDHIPFRQTKLTHALKDSLGGNCNTVLVANIFGEASQIEETLSTLRFASRMKCVHTSPAVTEHMDPSVQIIKLQKEVQMLKDELSMYNTLAQRPDVTYEPLSEAQQAEIQSQVQGYIDGSLEEISIISIRQVQAVFAQFKLAVQKQEQKVKDQLCQTYNLVKKDQNANAAVVKECDTRSSSHDVEADSFALSQKLSHSSTKAKTKRSRDGQNQSLRQEEGIPVLMRYMDNASKSKLNSVRKPKKEPQELVIDSLDKSESKMSANEPVLPESPPTKAEAFEDFKLGQGSKINLILKENKAILLERRSLFQQLTEEVSTVKREMDCITATLQQHEMRGGPDDQYLLMDWDSGLQQTEASLLMRLGELGAKYQQRYEALGDIKAEVNYCQHLVDKCRVCLLSEFETWYKQHFQLPMEPNIIMNKNGTQSQEKESQPSLVQSQRELLPDSPSSESFFNARYRTLTRRHSRVQSAAPFQSPGSRQRRLPLILPFFPVK
ncbi:kinesin-like protein KIF9 isoform X2 [Melanotaenia boesemani]|uniref:kinesin-like protein KIF9 isoform X2 n=1 Tax=Melanotaenia boesemani TaxID=1250792 RepID=UPI001C050985|nr:kinesin-like protein KIF9 isoform X2 [Melanotaenia boesemani]